MNPIHSLVLMLTFLPGQDRGSVFTLIEKHIAHINETIFLFYDGGNKNIIDEADNIYFTGGAALVKVEIVSAASSVDPQLISSQIEICPNPATSYLEHPFQLHPLDQFKIMSLKEIYFH
ncbi:MAG: hypothetical protein AAFR87_14730 [Bacteroidota bacterium]